MEDEPHYQDLRPAEEKIKAAATRLFMAQGFDAVKTRDIAREAGINLALLNYYFRSKKNLYRIIMLENFQVFFQGAFRLLNQRGRPMEEKLAQLVNYYIEEIGRLPHLPAFVLNEVRSNPAILDSATLAGMNLKDSVFFKELQDYCREHRISYDPLHLVMNLVSLVLFPFLAAPMIRKIFALDDAGFNALMNERKQLVPIWFQSIMQTRRNE